MASIALGQNWQSRYNRSTGKKVQCHRPTYTLWTFPSFFQPFIFYAFAQIYDAMNSCRLFVHFHNKTFFMSLILGRCATTHSQTYPREWKKCVHRRVKRVFAFALFVLQLTITSLLIDTLCAMCINDNYNASDFT